MFIRDAIITTIGASLTLSSLICAGKLLMHALEIAKDKDEPLSFKVPTTIATTFLSGYFLWHARDMIFYTTGMEPRIQTPHLLTLSTSMINSVMLAMLLVELGSKVSDWLNNSPSIPTQHRR